MQKQKMRTSHQKKRWRYLPMTQAHLHNFDNIFRFLLFFIFSSLSRLSHHRLYIDIYRWHFSRFASVTLNLHFRFRFVFLKYDASVYVCIQHVMYVQSANIYIYLHISILVVFAFAWAIFFPSDTNSSSSRAELEHNICAKENNMRIYTS